MISLVTLLALMQVPIPPPPENYSAAIEFWKANAPSALERRSAIDSAIESATSEALANIGVAVTPGNIKSVKRWLPKFDALKPVIARHVPADLGDTDSAVAECVMKDTAYALSLEDIMAVKSFMATTAGSKFWSISRVYHQTYVKCYNSTLNIHATEADYRAAGLVSPKPAQVKRSGLTTVN